MHHKDGNGYVGVLLVGLGQIALTHVRTLSRLPDVEVVAGVDPVAAAREAFEIRGVRSYSTIAAAALHHEASLVVVATPTGTHAVVYDEVAASFPDAHVLVEKPLADRFVDAERLLSSPAGEEGRIDVAYHMLFSPEVRWGEGLAPGLGAAVSVKSLFTDPYARMGERARNQFESSWLDSGVNALSVLTRFCRLRSRSSLRSHGEGNWSVFEATVLCDVAGQACNAQIITSWHVAYPTKVTRIRYDSGCELVLDHHGVAGYLMENGMVKEMFGSDRRISRQEERYRGLYDRYIVEGRPTMPLEESRQLHDVLLRARP